jgi:hypothetical protein
MRGRPIIKVFPGGRMSHRPSVFVFAFLLLGAAAFGRQAVASSSGRADRPSLAIHDVDVDSILAPRGTIDSGQTATPRCIVANYGDTTEDVRVLMDITDAGGVVYQDSLRLNGFAPAARETVSFSDWIAEGRDSMTATVLTFCAGDSFPDSDTCLVRFFVRVKSIEIHILVPQNGDTFDSCAIITPRCRVTNTGNVWLVVDLEFRLHPGAYVYQKSVTVMPGGSAVTTGIPFGVGGPGEYFYTVEARGMAADTSYFWVRGGSGVEETPNAKVPTTNAATIVRGVLYLPCGSDFPVAMNRGLEASPTLLDATGRRVAELHSGANDVSSLSPGVYFVRDKGRGTGDEGRMRKVIIQR